MTALRTLWPAAVAPPLTAALLLLVVAACAREEPMRGTVLSSPGPAHDFRLTDQRGEAVSLSDFRGKVVVLTFLYTSCRDLCPVVTFRLKETLEELGPEAERVALVAVTVDPERDDVERLREYSQRWGMSDRWSFVTGPREELEQVWRAYYVDPSLDDDAGEHPETDLERQARELTRRATGSVAWLEEAATARFSVLHSAPVYLIDPQGVVRVLFTPPLTPEDIAHDVRALLP